MDCPTLCDPEGNPLLELKIRVFDVLEEHRGQGIGTALQREALRQAVEHGCYQVRSRSAFSCQANYAIKQKLGFAAHPGLRHLSGGDESGIYWVKAVGLER
jgi:GNAT superfamily N-acetyltransferase